MTADSPTASVRTVNRRWTVGSCVWCGSKDAVETFRNEPRCDLCREKEGVIDAAKQFLGMYGLRPLGGTLDSEDEEEREFRVNAREARAVLNQIRLAKLPDPKVVRKAMNPEASAVLLSSASGSVSSAAPAAPKAKPRAAASVDRVDLVELQIRVQGLMEQLGTVDEQIDAIGEPNGLPARARLADLTRTRTSILGTLGALEKARRRSS